jgi:hypothetical protein
VKHGLLKRLEALEQKLDKFASTQEETWAWYWSIFQYYARGLKPAAAKFSATRFHQLLDYQSEEYVQAVSAGDEALLEAKFKAAWDQVFSETGQDLERMIAVSPAQARELVISQIPENWFCELEADILARDRQRTATGQAASRR